MPIKLYDFLKEHANKSPVSFHMPGHKGSQLYKRLGYKDFLHDFLDYDITEISGADNLFQAEDVLKEVQDAYARLYEVPYSYLLVNGSSGGIIASILACVPKGKKLLMARNCHKSAFNALTLGDIRPVYAYPEILPGWGISGAISPQEIEKHLSADTDIEAVILPSPNYYGICSDITAIAEIVHRHGKVLIVDQAHGAHLKFFSKWGGGSDTLTFPSSAEEQGADIVINSIHKTLASMTQSAVLNLNSRLVDRYMLEDKLQCIQSTSPSYILMASLDINCDMLTQHGEALIRQWVENLNYFYTEAGKIEGLRVMNGPRIGEDFRIIEDPLSNLDMTKINLDVSLLGISGAKLEALLLEEDIFAELYTGNLVMCMTGIGNHRSDYTRLLDALRRICKKPSFQFEDIVNIDDLYIQRILREVDMNDLAVAISSADQDIKDAIFRNMSTRATKLLQEELDLISSVNPASAKNARKRIVDIILRLDAALEIVIWRGRSWRQGFSVVIPISHSDDSSQVEAIYHSNDSNQEEAIYHSNDSNHKKSDFLTQEEIEVLLAADVGIVGSKTINDGRQAISDISRAKLVDIPKNKRRVNLTDATGCVCASSIIPYPPGIPLICPGEIIEQHHIDHIKSLRNRGEKVIGVNALDEIVVGV